MHHFLRLTAASCAALGSLLLAAPLYAQGGASELQGTPAQRCANLEGEARFEACRQALEAEPERPELWFYFGQALTNLNRHAAAARAYDRGSQLVRARRDAAVARLPGYQETVAPFLRDMLRFEGQKCQASVRAQRQQMGVLLNDAAAIQQLEAAIASGQIAGEELENLQEMRADIDRFRNNPAALEARMQEALNTCRDRVQSLVDRMNAAPN